MIKTQFGKKIKVHKSDNGKEYLDRKFQDYLVENGIIGQTSCVNPNKMGWSKGKTDIEGAGSLCSLKMFQSNIRDMLY